MSQKAASPTLLLLRLGGGPEPPHTGTFSVQLTYLITVVDVGVRKLPCHELIQDNAIGVDVRLEAERVIVLHSDHLWGLQAQHIHHHPGPRLPGQAVLSTGLGKAIPQLSVSSPKGSNS